MSKPRERYIPMSRSDCAVLRVRVVRVTSKEIVFAPAGAIQPGAVGAFYMPLAEGGQFGPRFDEGGVYEFECAARIFTDPQA